MKNTDKVLLSVVVDGTHVGIAQDVAEVERMLKDYVDYPNMNAEYLQEYVEVYPVLSTEPIEFDFVDEGEYEVETDESHHGEVSYTITDIDESFDTEEELQDFIKSALEDGDYTEDQVKWWDIEMTMTYNVEVEIESDKEVVISADIPTISAYVATEEVADLIAYEKFEDEVVSEPHYEDTDKPLPLPTVHVDIHELSYVTHYGAVERVRNNQPTYCMFDDGKGRLILDMHDLDKATESGWSFARLVE